MHKMTKLAQAVFVTSNKRGNEHRLHEPVWSFNAYTGI